MEKLFLVDDIPTLPFRTSTVNMDVGHHLEGGPCSCSVVNQLVLFL